MIPREFQLLVCCASSQPDAGAIEDLVHGGVNWQTLLEFAQQHGVRPLLQQSLMSVCWDFVPRATRLELERSTRANIERNRSLTGELFRLLAAFQRAGISIAAFKGPILADTVYGDISLREFSDLDVLIRKGDLLKAEELLLSCGYRAQIPDRDYRAAFLSYQGQYAFCHVQAGNWVDLHWSLATKGMAFPIQPEEVWPRLVQVTISGRTVPTLAPDDLALYLAAHGTKDGWRRLLWVCDFARLLRECRDIDWLGVLDRAQRSHSSRPLLLAVHLAATLLDSPAPEELVKKARDNPAVCSLAEEVRLRMVRTAAPTGQMGEFFDGLNTYDLLRHRLWPVATLLTTRTVGDHQAMPLPKPLWGIYYLTRPLRLAGKVVMEKILRRG